MSSEGSVNAAGDLRARVIPAGARRRKVEPVEVNGMTTWATARLNADGSIRVALHAQAPYGAFERTATAHIDLPADEHRAEAIGKHLTALLERHDARLSRLVARDVALAEAAAVRDPDDPETDDDADDGEEEVEVDE